MHKILLTTLLVLVSGTFSFASADTLLLDASCKITCVQPVELCWDGCHTPEVEKIYYKDILGASRSQIEEEMSKENLQAFCLKQNQENRGQSKADCLYFKNK